MDDPLGLPRMEPRDASPGYFCSDEDKAKFEKNPVQYEGRTRDIHLGKERSRFGKFRDASG